MAFRQRRGKNGLSEKSAIDVARSQTESSQKDVVNMRSFIKNQPVWILLAVASGACAAINGVFAKLTTTSLTGNLAVQLSTLLGLQPDNKPVNLALRGSFFGLNLLFNGVMWALFTAALTKGDSTTRVSIINVSANFFVTAIMGWAIFDEKLPLGWWMGAGLLAAGNVVIGKREEGEQKASSVNESGLGRDHTTGVSVEEEGEEDLIELDNEIGRRRGL